MNPFLVYSHNFVTKKEEIIPRFRSLSPYKTPAWFFKHDDLVDVSDWIEVNIFSCIPILTDTTISVLIRIATGMLNKCNLQKTTIIQLHQNLINNINSAFEKQLLSELPF